MTKKEKLDFTVEFTENLDRLMARVLKNSELDDLEDLALAAKTFEQLKEWIFGISYEMSEQTELLKEIAGALEHDSGD